MTLTASVVLFAGKMESSLLDTSSLLYEVHPSPFPPQWPHESVSVLPPHLPLQSMSRAQPGAAEVSAGSFGVVAPPGLVTGRVTDGRGVVVSCGSKIYESKSLTFPRTTLPLHCWNWHLPSLSLSQATFINAIKEIDARWYPLSYSSLSPLLSIDRKLPVSDNILWVVDRVAPIHIIFTGIFALSQGWVLDIVLWTVCCAAYTILHIRLSLLVRHACMPACGN